MKEIIKLQMNKLPFLKGYFYLLDMITFAIYYLASIKSLSSFPDTSHSIKKKCLEQQKFYIQVIPSVFPPLPTTIYIRKEITILFKELVDKMEQYIIDETNSNIYRILDNDLKEYFNEDLKKRIIKEIEKIIYNILDIEPLENSNSKLIKRKNKKFDFFYVLNEVFLNNYNESLHKVKVVMII